VTDKNVRDWLVKKLTEWRYTFDNKGDEKNWDELTMLINKVTNNRLTKNDRDDIIFHLWQIYYDEE
jgi:hypothetical protein